MDHLFQLLASLSAIAISIILSYLLHRYFVLPASTARKLRQHGFRVLPYRPLAGGNASDIEKLQAQAQLSDLSSPAAHHEVPAHVQPFYTKALSEFQGDHKDVVVWWGRGPTLLVTNPDMMRFIMSLDYKSYAKAEFFRKISERLFGKGLLLAEGADWHNQRAILGPAFFADKLKEMVADMHVSALQLTNAWHDIVESSSSSSECGGVEVEVSEDLKGAMADIIARTSFGSDFQAGKAVFEDLEKLLVLSVKSRMVASLIPGYRYLPTPNNIQCWKLEHHINKELSCIINDRLRSMSTHGSSTDRVRTDLLSLMLARKGSPSNHDFQSAPKSGTASPLTANQIIDQCKTFYLAGHETTARFLAWTMMLLSVHQEWQDKLRDEARLVMGGHHNSKSAARPPEAEQLNKLKLMAMVLNESLRLYPPAPELAGRAHSKEAGRTLKDDAGDAQGNRLRQLFGIEGMGFTIPILQIHRDTSIWGDDAHQFRPERFTEGVSKAAASSSAFLPFGYGPRICIGQAFAVQEAKVVLVAILQRFRFRLSPSYRHNPVALFTMRPKHGMQIVLQLLDHEEQSGKISRSL